MPQRVRLPSQDKPITLALYNNNTNALIQQWITNADEVDLPDGLVNFYYDVTTSSGQVARRVIDNATRILQSKNHIGRSVADGNPINHMNAINSGASRGYTYTGTIFRIPETDASLLAFGNSEFDHTVSHGSYAFEYDQVVRTAYLTSPGNTNEALQGRNSLRVSIHLALGEHVLNNGSTRTLFYNLSDCNMRPDQTTPTVLPTGGVPAEMIPSIASSNVIAFANRALLAFMKRYRLAINDGTILSVGFALTDAAESEYITYNVNSDMQREGESYGDFHPAMVLGFKNRFPEYAGVSSFTIANNDMSGSLLGKRWTWYLSDVLRRFEWDRIAYVKANLPQLTRTKWWQIDVGSFCDAQAARRRTYNSFARCPNEIMMIKSNDSSNQDAATIRFSLDDLASIARYRGAIAVAEPSPPQPIDGEGYAYVTAEMIMMKELGIGMSFINADGFVQDTLRVNSNFQEFANPKYKAEFKNVGGERKLVRGIINLSEVLSGAGMGNKRAMYDNLKASQSMSTVDIVTFDDFLNS